MHGSYAHTLTVLPHMIQSFKSSKGVILFITFDSSLIHNVPLRWRWRFNNVCSQLLIYQFTITCKRHLWSVLNQGECTTGVVVVWAPLLQSELLKYRVVWAMYQHVESLSMNGPLLLVMSPITLSYTLARNASYLCTDPCATWHMKNLTTPVLVESVCAVFKSALIPDVQL